MRFPGRRTRSLPNAGHLEATCARGAVRLLARLGFASLACFAACARPTPPQAPAAPLAAESEAPVEADANPGDRQVGPRISTYYLSSGDEIRISVFGYPDLTRTVRIPPDGHLFFPTLGDVDVDGMSIPELRDEIAEKLRTAGPQRIGVGDQVAVRVYRNDDLNQTALVPSSGGISIPLAGEVHLAGLTVEGASQAIAERLTPYIVNPSVTTTIQKSVSGLPGPITDPRVSVEVMEFGGHKIIVLGEVAHPEVYVSVGGSRLLEMVARAGGPTQDAKLGIVALVRPATETAQQVTAVVDLGRAIGGDLTQNPPVQRGDVIYVPEKTFSSLAHFFEYVYKIVRPFVAIAYPSKVVFQ